jgi:hypothetical protein
LKEKVKKKKRNEFKKKKSKKVKKSQKKKKSKKKVKKKWKAKRRSSHPLTSTNPPPKPFYLHTPLFTIHQTNMDASQYSMRRTYTLLLVPGLSVF